jgi:hypothetical protein
MRIVGLLVVLLVFVPTVAQADLNEDFAVCRRIILQIGSDPKSLAEQYYLGLSYAFVLNHKRDW